MNEIFRELLIILGIGVVYIGGMSLAFWFGARSVKKDEEVLE